MEANFLPLCWDSQLSSMELEGRNTKEARYVGKKQVRAIDTIVGLLGGKVAEEISRNEHVSNQPGRKGGRTSRRRKR